MEVGGVTTTMTKHWSGSSVIHSAVMLWLGEHAGTPVDVEL